MKYNESNKPIVCMQTQSTCYKGTTVGKPVGVLWHDTGAGNPWIKRYVQPSDNDPNKATLLQLLGKNQYGNDWNHITHQAGLNAWIGKLADGTVSTVQSMPWTYRPWGCGSGSKGSCNGNPNVYNSPFWLQFELCDDSYKDKSYFESCYKEACEFTAYICKLYNIDPKGTYTYNGVVVPTIICHQDSYRYGLGGNHGDVYLWFNKYGKTMSDVRNDVYALLHGGTVQSATNPPAQNNTSGSEIKAGSLVKVAADATYYNGKSIADWIKATNWYVKSVSGDRAVIDKSEDGKYSICSPVNVKHLSLVDYTPNTQTETGDSTFEPYKVKVTVDELNIRKGPGTNYDVVGTISKGGVYTIVKEQNGWGFLKSGIGWISLRYVTKL